MQCLGRTHGQICPIAATCTQVVTWWQGPGAWTIILFEEGRLLTRDRFVMAVHEVLAASGVDTAKYAGHSFRIGESTTAAERGVQDSLIKTMGRAKFGLSAVYPHPKRHVMFSGRDIVR